MVFPSSWISQSIQSQNSMFSGMQSYAMQASYGAGLMQGAPPAMAPQMAPPPPPTMMGVMRGHGGYAGGPTGGAWGEALAGRLANAGQMGMGFAGAGMAGLGVAGSLGLIGGPLGAAASLADPFGMALRAGGGAFSMAGGGMGGLAAGGLAAGAVALPLYAGAQWAGGLARNFMGGMQDQMSLNSTLRQNFNFMGGQGAFGRGFGQQQMGQIGGMVSQELRNNVFTSAGELNQVIAGGAQMGTFSGVRDAQEFGKRFKEMITTLKTVQRELGGSLAEAQEFISQSRQAGIFGSTAATRFASTIRGISASTGFDQGQLMQIASNGSQIARAFGGNGSQGAFGALRGINTVSTAMQSGMISENMLSEATGGLTGSDAMQAFVGDMMQRTGRFSRRAMGRYSIFGMSNRDGTGLDEGALMRFQMGDMGVGELSRMAHGNVGHMGRARAVNREGMLRGALMEQGGISGQIGMMRMMVGDRIMDQGDDTASLVLQRRFGMQRPQAEMMMALMRNQTQIAQQEAGDRVSSSRESGLRTEIREHRSVDAFMRHLEHGVQDSTGMLKARELGRDFTTRISGLADRLMNDLLGIASENMSQGTRQSFQRMSVGAGRSEDYAIMRMALQGNEGSRMVSGRESFGRGLFQSGPSVGERMERFGFDTSGFGGGMLGTLRRQDSRFAGTRGEGLSSAQMERASRMMMLANSGSVTGRSAEILAQLEGNRTGSTADIVHAMTAARGVGDETQMFSFLGGGNADPTRSAAYAAYMARNGMANPLTLSSTDMRMAGQGGGVSAGMIGRDLLRAGVGAFGVMTGGLGLVGAAGAAGAMGLLDRGTAGGNLFRSEVYDELTRGEVGRQSSLDFFSSGGAAATDLRSMGQSGSRNAAQFAARGQAISGVDRDVMQTTMGRSDVRSAVSGLLSDDPNARQNAVQQLQAMAASEPNEAQRQALMSLSENAEHLSRTGDPEARRAFLDVAVPQEEREAYIRETQQLGRSYSRIAQMIGTTSRLDRGLGRIGEDLTGVTRAGDAFGGIQQLVSDAADLGDTEFQSEISRLTSLGEGASEEDRQTARALAMQMSGTRQQRQDLMGNGRRGQRQSRETALSMLTGGSLGGMEFQIGGRRVRGRNIADMLTGEGGRSDEMRRQLVAQLQSQGGMSETAASDISRTLSDVYSSGGAGGRSVTREEARRIQDLQRTYGRDFDRISQEQQQRALSNASARDPVGAETNRILGEVNSVLRERLRAPEGGGEPNMSTPNG